MTVYQKIATTISLYSENPEINSAQIAKILGVLESDFQKIWRDWCGVEFDVFSSFLSLKYRKTLLTPDKILDLLTSLLANPIQTTSQIRPKLLIPELKLNSLKMALNLNIFYSHHDSLFGEFLVASTGDSVCSILFFDSKTAGLSDLKSSWSECKLVEKVEPSHLEVAEILKCDLSKKPNHKIKLQLFGTDFQLKVWKILASIPFGQVNTYGVIAAKLGDPNLARAVGAAIGANPIGFLMPCHRVIASNGDVSGYRWGVDRKLAMLGYEAIKTQL